MPLSCSRRTRCKKPTCCVRGTVMCTGMKGGGHSRREHVAPCVALLAADQIAILAGGRLRALGTSLFLKSHYGNGFSIGLECHPRDQREVEGLVKRLLHGASIVSPVAGSLTVALPKRCMRALPDFFRECEAGQGGVRSFSISNTTLEGAWG